MIKSFLEGKPHPRWTREEKVKLYGLTKEGTYNLRSAKMRNGRFLQMLTTVDGVIAQKLLGTPEIHWDWERFEKHVIFLIAKLLPEEFLDGEFPVEEILSYPSGYEDKKEFHNFFKLSCGRKEEDKMLERLKADRRPLYKIFLPDIMVLMKIKNEDEVLIRRMIFSQKRGVGTPSARELTKTKIGFIKTVTTRPESIGPVCSGIIKDVMRDVLAEIPDEALTGLSTKAGINVATNSACFERMQKEDGNIQAINDLVYDGTMGKTAIVFDLETGEPVEEFSLNIEEPGTYVFWRCIEEVLTTEMSTLSMIKLGAVRSPAKVRAFTKSKIAPKVVLDVVNGILAWVMSKGILTSTSGMEKESHAWNFFKEMCRTPWMFEKEKRDEIEHLGPNRRNVSSFYKEVFAGSTDFTRATDEELFEVGEALILPYMKKVGIPAVLREIVIQSNLRPRVVLFPNKGCMSKYGSDFGDGHHNFVVTERGIMMGDPVTKIILHLTNVVVRKAAVKICSFNNKVEREVWINSLLEN
jgi:hypothetical protein